MNLRYSFDLGTNSIGWAVYELGHRVDSLGKSEPDVPVRLVDMGVNLFRDGREPKTDESLAALRRIPRGARRRRDRFLQRRNYLLSLLEKYKLIPPPGNNRDSVLQSNPYPFRATAPDGPIDINNVGRVLFHLNQRRGFKSNRKATTNDKDDDSGKIASAAQNLKMVLSENGHKTLGQFLAERQSAENPRNRQPIRIRLHGSGAKASYEFYPLREMVEHEFDVIWKEQALHHPQLTEQARAEIKHAIFWQRPLKSVEPGRCTFFPEEPRLSDATELAQAFRIYQTINNLRVISNRLERDLTLEERDRLACKLMQGKDLTWTAVRKLLGIDSSQQLNLELGGDKNLKGNLVAKAMEGTSSKKPGPFHNQWSGMTERDRQDTLQYLSEAENDDEVVAWGMGILDLDEINATRLARIRLPDSYRRLSKKAIDMIVERLQHNVVTYAEAVAQCGLHHSDLGGDEHYKRLPPYNRIPSLQRNLGRSTGKPEDPPDKRFGRLSNPTVHIGLNQLRRTTNALIDKHGSPAQIVLELARELKQSNKQKELSSKRILENRIANDARRSRLEELDLIGKGQRTGEMILRLKLWEELGDEPRRCPYTGQVISINKLFDSEIEIEHILPFSRTLDNSSANKTVAYRRANRLKTNLSPAEAAERHPDTFDAEAMNRHIAQSKMPGNKRWRFEPDAMDRYNDEDNFMARQLNETQYLSRLSRAYLNTLFPRKDESGKGRQHVWVVPGRLTSLLRARLGVNLGDHNRKNRNDHRHHAIDAAIIGIIDRSLIQRVASISAKQELSGVGRLLADIEEPFANFRTQVMRRAQTLIVNSRAAHLSANPRDSSQTSGKLHEETYYGKIRDLPENQNTINIGNVVRRKPVTSLTVKEISAIRDLRLRASIQEITQIDPATGKSALSAKDIVLRLVEWSEKTGTHRVRVLKQEATAIPIHNPSTGEAYKYVVPAGNSYIDIYENRDGKWIGIGVDSYRANRSSQSTKNDAGTFIMRIHKGDFLQVRDIDPGENHIKRVHQLKVKAQQLVLAGANEGGELQKRHEDTSDGFRWDFATINKLKKRQARRVRFTPAGRMKTIPYGKP